MCAPDFGIHPDFSFKTTNVNLNVALEGINRVVRFHPLVNMNVCTKCPGTPSNGGGPTDRQCNLKPHRKRC